jgi:hypothetical protein
MREGAPVHNASFNGMSSKQLGRELRRLFAERADRALAVKYANTSGDAIRIRESRHLLARLDAEITSAQMALRDARSRERAWTSTEQGSHDDDG